MLPNQRRQNQHGGRNDIASCLSKSVKTHNRNVNTTTSKTKRHKLNFLIRLAKPKLPAFSLSSGHLPLHCGASSPPWASPPPSPANPHLRSHFGSSASQVAELQENVVTERPRVRQRVEVEVPCLPCRRCARRIVRSGWSTVKPSCKKR